MLMSPQTTTQVDYGDIGGTGPTFSIWIDKAIIEKLCATPNKLIPYEVVRRTRFLEGFEHSNNPLLRNAMCAFAALMAVPPAPLSIVQHYYEEARKNVGDALEAPNLQSLQGIITLSMVSNMLGKNTGVMSFLGYDNLSEDFDSSMELTDDEKETIKRCFLTCFAFDRVLGFTTQKPLSVLSGRSHAEILKRTPTLSSSDGDWLTSPTERKPSQSVRSPKISSAYLPTPQIDFPADGTPNYSEILPELSVPPLPRTQEKGDRNVKEVSNLMLAANSIAMLHEIMDLENNFGILKDLAGMGFGSDDNETRKGIERLNMYLSLEAALDDWYTELPEQRKLKSPFESIRQKVDICDFKPGDFLHPSVMAEGSPMRQEVVLGCFMVFFLYTCCRLQLHRSRLNLRSMLVKQEADFFAPPAQTLPSSEYTPSRPTIVNSFIKMRQSSPLESAQASSNSTSSANVPARPKFDYATSARLRKSASICLLAVRDLAILATVVGKAIVSNGAEHSHSPEEEYCVAVCFQSLLEIYLTLTTAGGIMYPSTRPPNGPDPKTLSQTSWIASVLERDEDGETVDKATWMNMVDEVVTLMDISLFITPSRATVENPKKHLGGIHPDIAKLMQDTVLLHEYKSRHRQTVTSPSSPLVELVDLSSKLHATGHSIASDLPMSSLGLLMAKIAKMDGPTAQSAQIREMVEQEEALHLHNMEKVLENARIHPERMKSAVVTLGGLATQSNLFQEVIRGFG
ncbi:hypothetical protein HDU97_008842 [Phlyctochytrium planicorne]|nr:hypothetical protein HDU97_008842 [Phlyctochytrium planicorne]